MYIVYKLKFRLVKTGYKRLVDPRTELFNYTTLYGYVLRYISV